MKLADLEAIVAALNHVKSRYLIVGGLAVAAHGYGRVTFDADLVIHLEPENLRRALGALETLGYHPTAPVAILDFADAETRKTWIREKHMVVFQLQSERHQHTPLDIFVSEPFDFDVEYKRSITGDIRPGLQARFVCLDTLIRMKESAGREKDREDVRQLKLLREDGKDG